MTKKKGPDGVVRPNRAVMFTPKKTLTYERVVADAFTAASLDLWAAFGETWPVDILSYELTVRVYRARRSGDLDNFIKSVTDGLNGIAWPDDRHVVAINARMFVDKANPRVEVGITYGEEDHDESTYQGKNRLHVAAHQRRALAASNGAAPPR